MASNAPREETTMSGITVKNTFLDVAKAVEGPVPRRSSSVPRAFKPGDHFLDCLPFKNGDSPTAHSDDSTNASDKEFSDCVSERSYDNDVGCPSVERCSECSSERRWVDAIDADSDESPANRVTLSLVSLTEGQEKARCKLRTQAQPFMSARTPPAEVHTVIASAVEVLASGSGIVDVHVHDGGMGGTTMIVAKSVHSYPEVEWLFSMAKDALLTSAARSENTYILGYGTRPFNNLDTYSFSANICVVPQAHKNTACWDTYEKGYCPRCTTCRWDHPGEIDTMRVIVMVKIN